MKNSGRISSFGGPDDIGMSITEGLAYYEHYEADLRPDLFTFRTTDPKVGASKRLRNLQSYYIALNIPGSISRFDVQRSLWKLANNATGQFILAQLVDKGPSASGRLVDASDLVLTALRLKTDSMVEIEEVTSYGIPFGLYGATL